MKRALEHDIFIQAEDMEELRTMVRDAVCCNFDSLYDEIC